MVDQTRSSESFKFSDYGINPAIPVDEVPKLYRSQVLGQSGVSVGLVPNGTVDASGNITLVTSLALVYSAGIWIRLPASAIVGGAAGLYWAVFSSGTVGVVKNIYIDPSNTFIPYIPANATTAANAIGSNAVYTQTTGSDITLINCGLIAGYMGNSGKVRVNRCDSCNNTANNKIIKYMFGDSSAGFSTFGGSNINLVSSTGASLVREIQNAGNMTAQIAYGNSATNSYAPGTIQQFALDTSINKNIILSSQLATATDFLVLNSCTFELLPGGV